MTVAAGWKEDGNLIRLFPNLSHVFGMIANQ